jgi:hypothetical protein
VNRCLNSLAVTGFNRRASAPGSLFDEPLRARRLIVRDTPAHAIELAMTILTSHGFVPMQLDLNQKLAQQGSPWIAQMVEIGDNLDSATRGCMYSCVSVVFPLIEFLPIKLRGVEHVEVVVTARTCADGSCELVLAPNTPFSLLSDSDGFDSSAARFLNAAIAHLIDSYQRAEALLVLSKPLLVVDDVQCPGFPKRLRKLRKA